MEASPGWKPPPYYYCSPVVSRLVGQLASYRLVDRPVGAGGGGQPTSWSTNQSTSQPNTTIMCHGAIFIF